MVARSNSQSLSQSTDKDQEGNPDLPIESTIARLISQPREIKITPEISSSKSPKQVYTPENEENNTN